jgi:hypothetical protein
MVMLSKLSVLLVVGQCAFSSAVHLNQKMSLAAAKIEMYVNSLALPEPSQRARLASLAGFDATTTTGDDNKVIKGPTAESVNTALLSYLGGLTQQTHQWVQDAVLLAQLAANKAADPEKDVEGWYKKYAEVLTNIGWIIGSFNWIKFKADSQNFQMSEAVIGILGAMLTDGATSVTVLKSTLEGLKSMSKDGQIPLFDHKAQSLKAGNFQVGVVSTQNDDPTITVGGFKFTAEQQATNVLFFTYGSSSTDLYSSNQTMTLNKSIYSKVASTVSNKVADHAKDYVQDIDI